MFNLREEIDKSLADWAIHTYNADNYTYSRCLKQFTAYELLHVRHGGVGESANFVHAVLFLEDYKEFGLGAITFTDGYDHIEDLVTDEQCEDAACQWAEASVGISVSNEEADRLADAIINNHRSAT